MITVDPTERLAPIPFCPNCMSRSSNQFIIVCEKNGKNISDYPGQKVPMSIIVPERKWRQCEVCKAAMALDQKAWLHWYKCYYCGGLMLIDKQQLEGKKQIKCLDCKKDYKLKGS